MSLVEITKAVGAPFFRSILLQVKNSLHRGYELQVLGHIVHGMLTGLSEIINVGDIDYCLTELVEVSCFFQFFFLLLACSLLRVLPWDLDFVSFSFNNVLS